MFTRTITTTTTIIHALTVILIFLLFFLFFLLTVDLVLSASLPVSPFPLRDERVGVADLASFNPLLDLIDERRLVEPHARVTVCSTYHHQLLLVECAADVLIEGGG
jgi:hypothetical protein